jgi:AcrR family transcriptional regulator
MAKAGTPSRPNKTGSDRSDQTRQSLVQAAIDTLKEHGYSGASARAIAERAGVAQGLVFYHYGSVANLLLAALDAVSAERLQIYGSAVDEVTGPVQLVDAAEGIFRSDLDAGYITVLVEMIAGASSTPDLGPDVAARIEPWREFARSAIESTLGESPLSGVVPAGDVAHAVVALYLGLEMLSHLDGDTQPALNLFAHAKQLASLFESMTTPATTKETT